jgi:fumarylacetoacetate (FAA) hydrolase family protein
MDHVRQVGLVQHEYVLRQLRDEMMKLELIVCKDAVVTRFDRLMARLAADKQEIDDGRQENERLKEDETMGEETKAEEAKDEDNNGDVVMEI